jgi:hypothetical protein
MTHNVKAIRRSVRTSCSDIKTSFIVISGSFHPKRPQFRDGGINLQGLGLAARTPVSWGFRLPYHRSRRESNPQKEDIYMNAKRRFRSAHISLPPFNIAPAVESWVLLSWIMN